MIKQCAIQKKWQTIMTNYLFKNIFFNVAPSDITQ